jgi:hypothetical protein
MLEAQIESPSHNVLQITRQDGPWFMALGECEFKECFFKKFFDSIIEVSTIYLALGDAI